MIMDADLQHPPEAIADFVAKWREGYQNIYGVRQSRDTDSPRAQMADQAISTGCFASSAKSACPRARAISACSTALRWMH